MKTWIRPMIIEECYVSNESIANSVVACYRIACNVGRPYDGAKDYSNGPGWKNVREYGGVWHEKLGTAGTCADADSNRVLSDGMVQGSSIQEHSRDLGWINGKIDSITPNQDNQVGPGAIVYWHTSDSTRRWNHKGTIELANANHPNHS